MPTSTTSDNQHSLPPTPQRLFQIAAGLAVWTGPEKAWLSDNPLWIEHLNDLKQALGSHSPTILSLGPAAHTPTPLYLPSNLAAADGDVIQLFGRDDDKVTLLILDSLDNKEVTIRWVGDIPPGRVTLLRDGVTLTLTAPFDSLGYATVLSSDISPVLNSTATLAYR